MIRNRTHLALAAALVASLAVVGCKKKEEPVVTPPAASEPAPMPAPAPMAATASVTGVDLGTAVGPDMKVTAPATTFKPSDTIFAAVATSTSDPMATVASKLGAKWSYQDGQTVNEETVDANLTGELAGGTWRVNLNGSYIDSFQEKALENSPYGDNLVGKYVRYYSLPLKWKHTLGFSWAKGDWSQVRVANRDGSLGRVNPVYGFIYN